MLGRCAQPAGGFHEILRNAGRCFVQIGETELRVDVPGLRSGAKEAGGSNRIPGEERTLRLLE
jgi:hypothetical protein